jgi:hypothetical protein
MALVVLAIATIVLTKERERKNKREGKKRH